MTDDRETACASRRDAQVHGPVRGVMPWLALLCLLLACGVARSATEATLYEATVPVAGQDAATRDQALSAALTEVLVRVSGNHKAPQHPALVRVIQNAQRLVQRYSYETAPALLLHTVFDTEGVARVLRAAGFNVWGTPRPQTLLWLALETGGTSQLIGSDAPAPLREALNDAAARRGLPTLEPLLDLEDQQQLQFSDVAGAFAERIVAASQRYQPDAVLAGHVRETAPDQWTAQWTLYVQGKPTAWQGQGTLQQAIDAGIDGAADILAQRTAHPPADTGAVQLHVSGIADPERFVEVEAYLTGLAPVAELHTVAVEPNGVSYALTLRGTRAELEQAIAAGALLQPEPGTATTGEMRYRVAP